jgi:hypothetical protein
VQDFELEKKLQEYMNDKKPNKTDSPLQPKDIYILKQKEELTLQKQIKSINNKLMNMA